MYSYLDDKFNLLGIEIKEKQFYFYRNNQLLLKGTLKPLKKIGLPVRPFVYRDCYVFLDYEKGIKIYKDNNENFIKLTHVWEVCTINNYIVFFSQKKLYTIDIETLEIVNEINRSENLDFCHNDNYALFYRFKNNKSYLIDYASNKTIELKNFIKDDILIHKIYVTRNNLYLLTGKRDNVKILKYNLLDYKITIEEEINNSNFNIAYYTSCFQMIVNDEYMIENKSSLNYIEYLSYIYKKYGFFVAINNINMNMIKKYKNSKYNTIVEMFESLIMKLNFDANQIKSILKFEKLKNEINNLVLVLNEEINKISII